MSYKRDRGLNQTVMSDVSAPSAPIAQPVSPVATFAWLPWALPIVAAVLILPIWIARLPAMPDMPAHFATFYLLGGGARNPDLARFYQVEWAFVPNLAAELVVPALAKILPLVAATKVFLSLIV